VPFFQQKNRSKSKKKKKNNILEKINFLFKSTKRLRRRIRRRRKMISKFKQPLMLFLLVSHLNFIWSLHSATDNDWTVLSKNHQQRYHKQRQHVDMVKRIGEILKNFNGKNANKGDSISLLTKRRPSEHGPRKSKNGFKSLNADPSGISRHIFIG